MRRRDVRRIIELSSKIEKKKINHHIFICGEGDMEGEIRHKPWLEKKIFPSQERLTITMSKNCCQFVMLELCRCQIFRFGGYRAH